MNERVQLRYCVVDCLKHDISSQGVKSVCKVQLHKDLVPRHARNEASGSVNRSFTAACWRGAKKDSSLVTANLFAQFAASRLLMYPIAIGLSPPNFLDKAMRVPHPFFTSTIVTPKHKTSSSSCSSVCHPRAFHSKLKSHLFKPSFPDSPDSISSHSSPKLHPP